MLRQISRAVLAALFIAAGANHFVSPAAYLQIMPAFLPWPVALIYISGVAEMAGGIGLLVPQTRRAAGLGLILLLIAVFPANIYGALHGMEIAGRAIPAWLLWARLPFQAVFVAWVWSASRNDSARLRPV